jgi:hypothetical protein
MWPRRARCGARKTVRGRSAIRYNRAAEGQLRELVDRIILDVVERDQRQDVERRYVGTLTTTYWH